MRQRFRILCWLPAVLAAVLLAACGFRLAGTTPLPFETLYTDIPDTSRFGADLRRSLAAASPTTRLVADPKEAQARLLSLGFERRQRELSLNPQGQVEEYELTLSFGFRLVDARGEVLIGDTRLTATRELPYDAQVVQAKQSEMERLFLDMERGLVGRVLRRLTAVRPAAQP